MTKPLTGEIRQTTPTGHLRDNEIEVNTEIWSGDSARGWIPHVPIWVELTPYWSDRINQSTRPVAVCFDNVDVEQRLAAEQDLLADQGLSSELPDYGTADAPLLSPALRAQVEDECGARVEHELNCGVGLEAVLPVYGTRPGPVGYSDHRRMAGDQMIGTLTVKSESELAAAIMDPAIHTITYTGPVDAPKPLENSGFNVNYYNVHVANPKREGKAPYTFEVEDIIEAANMTFHEGNVLKSLIRSVNERNHGVQKQGSDYVRDAEKMVHSSKEELRRRQLRAKEGKK